MMKQVVFTNKDGLRLSLRFAHYGWMEIKKAAWDRFAAEGGRHDSLGPWEIASIDVTA